MNASNNNHGSQRTMLTMTSRLSGKVCRRQCHLAAIEINASTERPRPSAALVSATPKLRRPNDSNPLKWAPNGVCRKCCMAVFHALTTGNTGGLKFCALRQKIFPIIPHQGDGNLALPHELSPTPLQSPV